jgi:hypothetical protein
MLNSDVHPEDEAAMSSSRILEEALGSSGFEDAPRRSVEEKVELPSPPPSASGGLKPMIERKRKEMIDLEKRLLNHEEGGTYTRKGEDGRSYFDYVAMQKDSVLLQQLKREYDELRERDRDFATRAATQSQRAQGIARKYAERELPKVPERARKAAAQMFADIFKRMDWSKPEYADQSAVQAVVEQIFDTAFGNAIRRSSAAPDAPAASAGYDADDDPPAKKKTGEDEDDFTNNLMYAYDRRRRGSMTVAEAKRAAAAAAQKGVGDER